MTAEPLTRRDIELAVWTPTPADAVAEARAGREMSGYARPAAVLFPIIERPEGMSVLLTVRAATLRAHAGQIAFPGGKIDAEDGSPLHTALREAREEIGLDEARVDVIGRLDKFFTGTGFVVTPFVGFVDSRFQPVIDPGEVAQTFEAPIEFVLNPSNARRCVVEGPLGQRFYYEIPYNGYRIWGATAGMIRTLSVRVAALRRQGAAATRQDSVYMGGGRNGAY